MSDEPDPLLGTTLADRYRVVARIGQGGAGHVYRGIQLQLEREVAIKVVRPDVVDASRAELEARFFREAALAGRLAHPNIVQMIDYGSTTDGRQFVVMELLRGRTLKRALKGPMDPAEAARLGAAIARGLHHAHSRGMVHRDVKSTNIFLVQDEEGLEHPKLLDFGLVKSVRRELDITQTPTYLGTPLYMSPEQARGELDVDGRSDIYSLGCLLYRMVAGEMPFRGETAMATAFMHVNDPLPTMAERVPGCRADPALEAIVRRCLQKDRNDRWPDGATLAQALDSWREAQSTAAVGVPQRSPGWLTALMGAVGVLGLLGIVVGAVAVVVAVVAVAGVLLWPASAPTAAVDASPAVPEPRMERPGDPPLAAVRPDTDTDADAVAASEDSDAAQEGVLDDGEDGGGAKPPPAGRSVPREAPPVLAPAAPTPPSDPMPGSGPPPAPDGAPTRNVGEDVLEPGGAPPVRDPVVPVEPVEPVEPIEPGAWQPVTVDKYTFRTRAHAQAAVRFANTASRDELLTAGVSPLTVDAVLDHRPFADVVALGAAKGIGPGTMYKLATHTLTR